MSNFLKMEKRSQLVIEGVVIYSIAGLLRVWLGTFDYVNNCSTYDVMCLDSPQGTFHNTVARYVINEGPLVSLAVFLLATLIFGLVIYFQRNKK